MITDMISSKNTKQIVTELFIRVRELNISNVFIHQSYFAVPKDVRINCTFFIMKIPNKQELQEIPYNHSTDINLENFMKL